MYRDLWCRFWNSPFFCSSFKFLLFLQLLIFLLPYVLLIYYSYISYQWAFSVYWFLSTTTIPCWLSLCLDRKVPRFFNHIIFYLEDNPVQFWEDPNLMPSRYSYRQCQKLGKAENAVSVCTLHPITKFLRFLRLFLRYFCAISTLDSV